eukprot:14264732-Ditylum_brightwellii.AAC.1
MAHSVAIEGHVLQLANKNRVCLTKRQNYNAKLELVNNRFNIYNYSKYCGDGKTWETCPPPTGSHVEYTGNDISRDDLGFEQKS